MERRGCLNVAAELVFAFVLTVCIGTGLWLGGLLGLTYLRGLLP